MVPILSKRESGHIFHLLHLPIQILPHPPPPPYFSLPQRPPPVVGGAPLSASRHLTAILVFSRESPELEETQTHLKQPQHRPMRVR